MPMTDIPKKNWVHSIKWWQWILIAVIAYIIEIAVGGDGNIVGLLCNIIWIIALASGFFMGIRLFLEYLAKEPDSTIDK